MENIVEKEALKFSALLFRTTGQKNNLEVLKSSLTTKLFIFNKEKDKLFFLNVLRKEVENQKKDHEKVCTNTDCGESEEKNIAIFLIDQEIDDISKDYEFKIAPDDEFTTQERVELHNKLNTIADRLEELGLGQEVIFEEIESLKENFNLGKKNWFQLLKGKLIDLAIKKVIDVTIIQELYNEISNGFPTVKGIIGT